MAFANVRELVDAELDGFTQTSTFRKVPTQSTTYMWFDLSMSPGMPLPQYYIGAQRTFTPLAQSTDGGIPHCADTGGKQEVLRTFSLGSTTAAVPLSVQLLDYLGFYAFVDEGFTDEQPLINTTGLTRYTDGAGVMIMAVVSAGQLGGGQYQVRYTNSDGEPDRLTPWHTLSALNSVGTLLNSCGNATVPGNFAPFMALQGADKGVRSIQGITFSASDIGLCTLVLVKPLARLELREWSVPTELDLWQNSADLPVIAPDAYLNVIMSTWGGTALATFMGHLKTVWA